jgi:hypothetical protein
MKMMIKMRKQKGISLIILLDVLCSRNWMMQELSITILSRLKINSNSYRDKIIHYSIRMGPKWS